MTADICVATIVAFLIALIAYNAWRRWRKTVVGGPYSYEAPAGLELVEVSDKLASALDDLVRLRANIGECPADVRDCLGLVVEPAARIAAALKTEPLTYGGAYSVYKNLSDADSMYARISDAYIVKGASIKCEPLIVAGKRLAGISGLVHSLGAALNVE